MSTLPFDLPARWRTSKAEGKKLAVLTAYDYPFARLLEEAGVDAILVGDSLGMVVLGYPDTTEVTLDAMVHHTAAVARGAKATPILADLPIGTYETPEQALASARRLIDAGAHAVKLEGGIACAPQIRAIVEAGIPVVSHIGMLPQSVREEGGYRIKGKTEEEANRLLADARAIEAAGAFGVIMELLTPEVSRTITEAISIPTIGIGAGEACDGQVLVTYDLVGMFPWFKPKFATQLAQTGVAIRESAAEFVARVRGKD